MSNICILQATPKDIDQIALVHAQSWNAEFGKLLPEHIVHQMSYDFCKDFWKKYFTNNSLGTTYIAKIDEIIAGFVAIQNKGCDWEIDKIYVSPEHQGQGIGSKLMQYVLNALREAGCQKVIVKVFIENTKAQSFYEKLGACYIRNEQMLDYHSTIEVKVYEFNYAVALQRGR